MPTYAQILAFTVALAVLIGFGTATTQSMRHLEAKQQRILNADIDRILAQRREPRREDVAKAQIPGPNQTRRRRNLNHRPRCKTRRRPVRARAKAAEPAWAIRSSFWP